MITSNTSPRGCIASRNFVEAMSKELGQALLDSDEKNKLNVILLMLREERKKKLVEKGKIRTLFDLGMKKGSL